MPKIDDTWLIREFLVRLYRELSDLPIQTCPHSDECLVPHQDRITSYIDFDGVNFYSHPSVFEEKYIQPRVIILASKIREDFTSSTLFIKPRIGTNSDLKYEGYGGIALVFCRNVNGLVTLGVTYTV